ncbi:MAG: hypothetical protein EOQ34_11225 [Mesorhizobium sp.]|nr:hypothetical protein [Mesorhizobium sp.]RWF72704.1 MAG: hypothetical protein EOQ34_11225 [Mesorhizobium sp.]
MAGEGDRIARAGDYVFGLMDERERARAERDLEIDPAFRDAVLRLAERMRALEPQPIVINKIERKPYGVGLHSLGGRLGLAIALALAAAFALGYLAGTL